MSASKKVTVTRCCCDCWVVTGTRVLGIITVRSAAAAARTVGRDLFAEAGAGARVGAGAAGVVAAGVAGGVVVMEARFTVAMAFFDVGSSQVANTGDGSPAMVSLIPLASRTIV